MEKRIWQMACAKGKGLHSFPHVYLYMSLLNLYQQIMFVHFVSHINASHIDIPENKRSLHSFQFFLKLIKDKFAFFNIPFLIAIFIWRHDIWVKAISYCSSYPVIKFLSSISSRFVRSQLTRFSLWNPCTT